ncbi:hypothetical protein [Streptomyces sp. NPDC001500]
MPQTAPTGPELIAADQVNPEDIATLSIEYRDGQPVVVVHGGTVIPASLAIVGADTDPSAIISARFAIRNYEPSAAIDIPADVFITVVPRTDGLR